MLSKALLGAGKAASPVYIEDVFSTYLYTGNGSSQTIVNNIAIGDDYGGSVFFDGAGDYLTVASNVAFNYGTGDFTIEFWFYPNNVSATRILYDQRSVSNNEATPTIYLSSSIPRYYVNGADRIIGGSALSNDQWYHIAVSRSGTSTRMFVNGTQVGSTFTDTTSYITSPVRIGAYGVDGSLPFLGFVSNCRVVKGTALYTSNFTPSTVPLTAISGTSLLTCQTPNTILDYSTNAFTITVTNAVAQNGGGPFTDSTANKGGLVWLKSRSAIADHALYDTARGATFDLVSNSTAAQTTQTTGLTAFNSNGFSIGSLAKLNTNAALYTSWAFREQDRFFDIRTVSHTNGTADTLDFSNLGTLGMVIVKITNTTGNWIVWHRSLTGTNRLFLNLTDAQTVNTVFTVSGTTVTITSAAVTGSYVVYAFAHDAGGFGAAGTDNVISCGSYTGTGVTGNAVTLGYEPQWILIKRSDVSADWVLYDSMRGIPMGTGDRYLRPNATTAETDSSAIDLTATGFSIIATSATWNASGGTYIYIAVRRGPMRPPTSGTSVLGLNARNGTGANATVTGGAGVTDLAIIKNRTGAFGALWVPRLAGTGYLLSSAVTSETAATTTFLQANPWDVMDGVKVGTTSNTTNDSGATYINYLFDRAPGFFDVVCYTGDAATTRNVNHNLGVSPEFVIIKRRSANDNWHCWHTSLASISNYLLLNTTAAVATSSNIFKGMSSTTFTLGPDSGVNGSGSTYVAYIFSSITGVSKVGGYTGNGSNQTINCGFAAGARFVMIKRTDSTGDWYVWDTARGIVSGNDPRFSVNTAAAEVTTDDSIDPDNSGFIVNQLAATNINVNAATYIFLAIA